MGIQSHDGVDVPGDSKEVKVTKELLASSVGGVNDPQASPPGSPTGYNSGDEYGSSVTSRPRWSPDEVVEMERRFDKILRKKGFLIEKMGEDGACLFRAVADQVYADEDMHSLVRRLCCDYMTKNTDYFSQYVTEDFGQYVSRKRREHIQGNHVELQALSELFARRIEVYHYSSEPINIFQSGNDFEVDSSQMEPIRISYHNSGLLDSGHYNSVRPLRPGLFKPKINPLLHFTPPQVVETAIRNSEADALEKAMLEDKIRATDWEATNEALEEQVARESYLEWVRETENRKRRRSGSNEGLNMKHKNHHHHYNASSSSSTATANESRPGGSRTRAWSPSQEEDEEPRHRHKKARSPSSFYYDEVPDGPETEREILKRVLLASRQEYLDSLKKSRKSPSPKPGSGRRSPKNSSRGNTPPPSSSSMA